MALQMIRLRNLDGFWLRLYISARKTALPILVKYDEILLYICRYYT